MNQRIVMHWKYFKYVLRHKWFVFVECCRLGIPMRGLLHDLSKFRPSEWFPYAHHFYRDNTGEGLDAIGTYGLAELAPWGFYTEDRFNRAWLKHQHRNPHHWQFWLLQPDEGQEWPLPMPQEYAKEMLADWIGAGLAIHGKRDVLTWYRKNRLRMSLHLETASLIEKLMKAEKASAS